MALKITKADEAIAVDTLVTCIYGAPGVGKSTLGYSAHTPIVLDFDGGAYRAANRGDTVQIRSWGDVAGMTAEDVADYSTIVVDTAGRALDALSADIIRRNPKMGRGGALSLQGFGQLKTEFAAWVKLVRSFGKDLVLIAHASEDRSGDEIVERIDMQGGSKQELYKVADAMGRLVMLPGNKLPTLTFSPSDTAFGKNPGQLEPLSVPDVAQEPDFLGGVVDTIKGRLNSLTTAQKARMDAIEAWRERILSCEDAEAINTLLPEAREADASILPVVRGVLHKHATETLGLESDKERGCYVAQEAAA